MTANRCFPSKREVRERAAEVRKMWSPVERAARRGTLPPDSVLRMATVESWGPSRHQPAASDFAPRQHAVARSA